MIFLHLAATREHHSEKEMVLLNLRCGGSKDKRVSKLIKV